MPYIGQDRRDILDRGVEVPDGAGELNYVLTWHLLNTQQHILAEALMLEVRSYIDAQVTKNYALYNSVIGALECCRREFRRRSGCSTFADLAREDAIHATMDRLYAGEIAPYENTKIEQNGDVY